MLSKGLNYISNSEIQTFKRCRRKWYLAWYLGLNSRYEDLSSIMRSGTRIHKALSQWYVPDRDPEMNLSAVIDGIINEDRATILSSFPASDDDSGNDEFNPTSQTAALKELESIAAYERAMISGYLQWIEETGIDSSLVPITTEQELRVSHPTLPIVWVGIVDALMWNKLSQSLEFMDHKTVQSLTQPILTLKSNEQMLHYLFLVTMAAKEKVSGAQYNMLRRVKRSASSKPPYYDRVFIGHSPTEIDSYRKHLYAVSYAIYSATERLNAANNDKELVAHYMYPSPTMTCSWDCPFFSVCSMFDDGSDVKRMLEYRYVKSNPLDRYENVNVIEG